MDERFWANVEKTDTCWLWTAGKFGTGYGAYYPIGSNRSVLAHRYAYEQMHGPIPVGLEIDHLCRVRACVLHLEAVTHAENLRRGPQGGFAAVNRAKTACPRGHAYTAIGRERICRTCRAEYERTRNARKRAS